MALLCLFSFAQPLQHSTLVPLTPVTEFRAARPADSTSSNTLILISQYYNPEDEDRQRELDGTLEQNLNNPSFDQVHILVESDNVLAPEDLRSHPRLVRTVLGERLTWRLGFAHAAQLQAKRPDERIVAIVSNSDIWFDETLAQLQAATGALQGRKAYVLMRYGDQDNWCVPEQEGHADSCLFAPPVAPEVDADYELGRQGTETRLVYELSRQGYEVSNPCLVLISHHAHTSGFRTYDPSDSVNTDGRSQRVPVPTDELPLQDLSKSTQNETQKQNRSERATGSGGGRSPSSRRVAG